MLIEYVPHGDILQTDRETAASIWFSHVPDMRSEPQAVRMLGGHHDDHVAIQGVARYRMDSTGSNYGASDAITPTDRRMAAFVWFAGEADMDSGPRVIEMLTGQNDDHRAVQAMIGYRIACATTT